MVRRLVRRVRGAGREDGDGGRGCGLGGCVRVGILGRERCGGRAGIGGARDKNLPPNTIIIL